MELGELGLEKLGEGGLGSPARGAPYGGAAERFAHSAVPILNAKMLRGVSRLEASKNRDGIAILDFPDARKSSFGEVWEACLRVLGCLGQSQCVLGMPGMHFECVLVRLGCVLEMSWGHLGTSWAGLGGFWASLGSFPGSIPKLSLNRVGPFSKLFFFLGALLS